MLSLAVPVHRLLQVLKTGDYDKITETGKLLFSALKKQELKWQNN